MAIFQIPAHSYHFFCISFTEFHCFRTRFDFLPVFQVLLYSFDAGLGNWIGMGDIFPVLAYGMNKETPPLSVFRYRGGAG